MSEHQNPYDKFAKQHQAQAQRVLLWFILPLCIAFFLWDLSDGDPGRKTLPGLVMLAIALPLGGFLHWREKRDERRKHPGS